MIEKSSASELIKLEIPYDVIPRESIQDLAKVNSDALAIWSYMMSMPPTWTPRKKHIRDVLKISENRYRIAMRDLKRLKLVGAIKSRGNNGRFNGGGLEFHIIPYDELPEDNSPSCSKTDTAVADSHIETDNVKETERNKKEINAGHYTVAREITLDTLDELLDLGIQEKIHPNQIKIHALEVLITAMRQIKQYADDHYEDLAVSINSMCPENWERCLTRVGLMVDIGANNTDAIYECLKKRLILAKRSGVNIVNTLFLLGTESQYHGLMSIEYNDDLSDSMKEEELKKYFSFNVK